MNSPSVERLRRRGVSLTNRLVLVGTLFVHTASIAGQGQPVGGHSGHVTFGAVPVPGATVTVSNGEQRLEVTTDGEGWYRVAELAPGVWTVRVEMAGFELVEGDIDVRPGAAPSVWRLTMLAAENLPARSAPTPDGARELDPVAIVPSLPLGPDPSPGAAGGDATRNLPFPAPPFIEESVDELTFANGDVLVVNGSVNNAAASPSSLPQAFGNNRPNSRSNYYGSVSLLGGHSAWDARPFSFSGQRIPKPEYGDLHMAATFGGSVRFPGMARRWSLFLSAERTANHSASAQSAVVPSVRERAGDFSQSRDALGRPVQVVDPATGGLFERNRIAGSRISPQALALLRYYPVPNLDPGGRFNYQAPILTETRSEGFNARLSSPFSRQQLSGTFSYRRTNTASTTLFGFEDARRVSNLRAGADWSASLFRRLWLQVHYQVTRVATNVTPFFAHTTNVSGAAGITGNNQDPENWGPPTLRFSGGLATLTDLQYGQTRDWNQAWSAEATLSSRGRHAFKFGGGAGRRHVDVLSQQNARGEFLFTGAATGSDLADFLLGVPQAAAIAFGNADKYLRAMSYHAYLNDDWRVSSGLTVTAGVRWEHETPFTERFDRLVNLDVAPGFSAVAPIVGGDAVGPLTGRRYPRSLVRSDPLLQPRVGVAWRPIEGSSLVVRAGYGIYRNVGMYQSIAMLMAQQPPLSTTLSVGRSGAHPLTLSDGFVGIPGTTHNTFAVDPDLRAGFAQNWQVSVRHDLRASWTVLATYFGTQGNRLMRQFLPNTSAPGAVRRCPGCPAGFVYVTSDGSSRRHAGQVQVRRRLRDGFTAAVDYTLSKAVDDGVTFEGVTFSSTAIAQDWRNLDAEHGPSSFDQRHLVTAEFEYTTGVGVSGLMGGLMGRLLNGWSFVGRLAAGSGTPLTPVYLTAVPGTGVSGTIRAGLTGAALDAVPAGFYLNPAAFGPPAPGQWGAAGRHSIRGPAQFSLDLGVGRTFPWGDRGTLHWRVEAANVLNRVTFAVVDMVVASPQFGLPNFANPRRKVQTSLRLTF